MLHAGKTAKVKTAPSLEIDRLFPASLRTRQGTSLHIVFSTKILLGKAVQVCMVTYFRILVILFLWPSKNTMDYLDNSPHPHSCFEYSAAPLVSLSSYC